VLGWDDADRDALEVLRPLLDAGGYLPWSEWALRPAALRVVCDEIVYADRREVVELGAGISSVVLGRLLARRGGRLNAVEHEPAWARVVRSLLEADGLSEAVRLVEAPLEPHPHALDGAPWYAASALDVLPDHIDLLLVDGPPGNEEGLERSRYPALPALGERLAPGAVVMLDDAGRPGEREILERWGADGAWDFAIRDEGIATGHSRPAA
jgi:predicted O-methyltransferase YrrM